MSKTDDLPCMISQLILVIVLFVITFGMFYYAFVSKQSSVKKKEKKNTNKQAVYNLVLFANGLYENLEKPNALWTQGIEESDFNTIILWTLHIRLNGDLVYNDFLMVSNGVLEPLYGPTGTNIATRISELKTYGNVESILFSIGSGSWYNEDGDLEINPDFYNLHQILFYGTQQQKDNLYNNLSVLINLGIDGFDSDCEEWGFFNDLTAQNIEDTHVELFATLYNQNNDLIFTFVPYNHRTDWINIAKALYNKIGIQIVKFWSVQMYGPGSGSVAQWINAIQDNAYELGLSADEVNKYIIPGYDNSGVYHPLNVPFRIREIFSGLVNSGLSVNGGMIWNLSQTYEREQTLQAYSQAIIDGLSSNIN
eukprot:398610_1